MDNDATIHFLSNQELLQAIKESNSLMKIHCVGTTFNQAVFGRLRNKSKYLPLSNGDVYIVKDGTANLLCMENLVTEGYRVQMVLEYK